MVSMLNNYDEIRSCLSNSISTLLSKKSNVGSYKSRNCDRLFVFDEDNYIFASQFVFNFFIDYDLDSINICINADDGLHGIGKDYFELGNILFVQNKTSFVRRINNENYYPGDKKNIFIFKFGDNEYRITANRFAIYVTERDRASHEDLDVNIVIKSYDDNMACYLVNPINAYEYSGIFRAQPGVNATEEIIRVIDEQLKFGKNLNEVRKYIISKFNFKDLSEETRNDLENIIKVLYDYIYWEVE